MKRYRNGGNNEYTYGCTTGQYNSNDWVIGRDHHVFYRGVDKMKISNINTVPISAIETFCNNHNLAMQCNDGKVGKAIKEVSNEL